jgi:UrcA family protein
MKQTLRIIIASALVTGALIKAVPAFADPAPAQNISIVQTADLDLSSKAGREALDHRFVTAAYEVCGTASNADLVGTNATRACRTAVLARARAEGEQLASRGAAAIFVAANR